MYEYMVYFISSGTQETLEALSHSEPSFNN